MKTRNPRINKKPPKWYLSRALAVKRPPMPKKKEKCIHTIWGGVRHWKIEGQIAQRQRNIPHKFIVVQRISIKEDRRYEYRFGYYMIGFKKGGRGKWMWGQYSPMIPQRELKMLIKEMVRKKWL